jgi:hypothetical protein
MILPIVLYRCEAWFLILREEHYVINCRHEII